MIRKFKIVNTIVKEVDSTKRLWFQVRFNLMMLILGITHVMSFPTMPVHHCAYAKNVLVARHKKGKLSP